MVIDSHKAIINIFHYWYCNSFVYANGHLVVCLKHRCRYSGSVYICSTTNSGKISPTIYNIQDMQMQPIHVGLFDDQT